MKQYPSQARLRELFDYEDESGDLIRKDLSSSSYTLVSEKHLTVHKRTYLSGKEFKTSDLVWIYFKGQIQKDKFVQSKAGAYSSKIKDLLLCDSSGSISRKGKKKHSNYLGVHKQNDSGNFVCQFSISGDRGYKGSFLTEEAAAACYDHHAKIFFGDHAILNGVYCDFEKFRVSIKSQTKVTRSSSGYKGVYPNKSRWLARIGKKCLGTHDTKEQAARAYNISARAHYGEHAVLNDIPDPLGTGDIF